MKNCLRHTLFIGEMLVVPNAKNMEAPRSQISISSSIAGAIGMLAAVKFDDQSTRRTEEVDDVVIDGHLSAKLEPAEPVSSNDLP